MVNKIIMHVDMDAFYASVEEREHPEYGGKPLIVGADPKQGKGRGVVSTCNYPARTFGIHSAMPISTAWKLCPQGIYLPPNFPLYEQVSAKIMDILRKYADGFMQVSIDEAFLDITRKVKDYEEAEQRGKEIKEEVMKKEHLTCSVGIGQNRLIAKIASDFKKPDGLTIVKPKGMVDFIAPLSVRRLYGIGPKTEEHLRQLHTETVGQLRRISLERLQHEFGTFGFQLHAMALGEYDDVVEEDWQIKSINRNSTFAEDTTDRNFILTVLQEMSVEIEAQLRSYKMSYKTITVRVRYENFDTHTTSKTLKFPAADKETIFRIAQELVQRYFTGKKIRQVGLRVAGLIEPLKETQKTLI